MPQQPIDRVAQDFGGVGLLDRVVTINHGLCGG